MFLARTADSAAIYAEAHELFRQRKIAAACAAFTAAESLGHDPNECAGARWMCWMLLGDFERAWQESDAIAARGTPDPHRLWDGTPPDGKRVILRCLHGFGDAAQFLRYAPLLRERAAHLTIETHPQLLALTRESGLADEVITWNPPPDDPPAWEQQLEIMELPRLFRSTAATLPAQVPYLRVDPHRREHARQWLQAVPRPRIGLVWAASTYDRRRWVPLHELAPLFELPGWQWVSLQFGPQREQRHAAPALIDPGDHLTEVADTAALMNELDLVLTVDTMAAHLAGALGRPVWTMLPWAADWRWMLDRPDSPWYPTMRLFRQPQEGDWKGVVQQVRQELRRGVPSVVVGRGEFR